MEHTAIPSQRIDPSSLLALRLPGIPSFPHLARAAVGRLIQRKCACEGSQEQEEADSGLLQRTASGPGPGAFIPQGIEDVLNSAGQPLEESTRAFMEPRFKHSFSQVRIHTDARAAESAYAVDALAYTVGQNIVFGEGQYRPHSVEGQKLIAHELNHTLQQSAWGSNRMSGSPLEIESATSPSEQESKAAANAIMNMPSPDLASMRLGGAGPARPIALQRKISPGFSRIKELMRERGFLQKDITERETHEVLGLLRDLSDEDLRDTVKALELEDKGYIERFLTHIGENDKRGQYEAIRRIKNMRYTKIETTTTDPKTKTTTKVTAEVTGSCSIEQGHKIFQATTTGLAWLDAAVSQLDAYLDPSGGQKNGDAEKALDLHFHSKTAEVGKHVRSRLDHIRQEIRNLKTLQIECHGTWDNTCLHAGAYASGGSTQLVVFCSSFFDSNDVRQAETVVHEVAHIQVGGAFITDRAYQSDRLLTRLTTAEALTNAESYGLLVQQLGTGKVPAFTAAKDTREDCPDDWWELLQVAIAQAQRWNRNLQVVLDNLAPASLKPPSIWGKYLGGTTQGEIDQAKKVINQAASRLASPIDFECEPSGGGRCDQYMTYWYAIGDFHICPSWKNQKSEPDRVETLLAGLYGYIGDVSDQTRQNNYARLARENNASWKSPTYEDVMGSSKWSPDEISIALTQKEPRLSKGIFWETGMQHERISDELPVYQAGSGQSAPLPYRCEVSFSVDSAGQGRPTPFTTPPVSIEFEYKAPEGGFKENHQDARPLYDSVGSDLKTSMPKEYAFSFDKNGSFRMHFHLDDPDAKISRDMDDTIQIKAV